MSPGGGHRRPGLGAVLAVCLALASVAAAEPPRRVVTTNLCADLLALELAAPGQLVSVSFLAADPRSSPLAEQAAALPLNRGLAEEIVALTPDLVIAGRHTARAATAMLERLGHRVMRLELAATLDDARDQIRAVATALGRVETGERMVRRIDTGLARVATVEPRPLALIYRPNGFTAGPATLPGAVLAASGLANAAGVAGIDTWGMLGLERVLWLRPRLLVVDERAGRAPALAAALLDHPALARSPGAAARVEVPDRLWGCPGPWLVEAGTRLADARARLLAP